MVDGSKLDRFAVSGIDQALQGRAAGFQLLKIQVRLEKVFPYIYVEQALSIAAMNHFT